MLHHSKHRLVPSRSAVSVVLRCLIGCVLVVRKKVLVILAINAVYSTGSMNLNCLIFPSLDLCQWLCAASQDISGTQTS